MSTDITHRIHEAAGIDGTIPRTVFPVEDLEDARLPDGVHIAVEDGTITVSYLTRDPHPGDPFDNPESAGVLRSFRRGDDPNDLMANIEGSGRIAFFVERYRHGADHYSVFGTCPYPDRAWDAGIVGIYIPPDDIQAACREIAQAKGPEAARSAAQLDATAALEDYTRYVNGDVFGAVVETWRVEGQHVRAVFREDCWGLSGAEHALEELARMSGIPTPDPDADPVLEI